MKFIRFPDIKQFRNVVHELKMRAQYAGKDSDGNPVYDENKKATPTIFTGTIKLDGTNASVCFDGVNKWFQSRERIITPDDDNYGFARYASASNDINVLIDNVCNHIKYKANDGVLCIYGEWIGKGIAKGMAINQFEEKRFVIFGVAIVKDEERTWFDLCSLHQVIKDSNFDTVLIASSYSIALNPDDPQAAWDDITLLTENVVKQCTYGQHYGLIGAGEGIVWVGSVGDKTFLFKTKGEKQSVVSSPKELPSLEQTTAIDTFVNDVLTENRLKQGIERVFTANGKSPVIEELSSFLKWISSDIEKEEGMLFEKLESININSKQVMKIVTQKSRKWFIDYLDKEWSKK